MGALRTLATWIAVALVWVAAAPAAADEDYPFQGMTPSQKIGGMVTVAGSPLPPVPRESLRAAIPIYEGVLAGVRAFGTQPAVARGCAYLATLHAALGNDEKAEKLFDEAQAILEKHGSEGYDLAWVYNNRGLVALKNREYAAGLRSFRKAVGILDPRHEEFLEPRSVALENLASSYSLLGDAEQAESAYLDALEILRQLRQEGSYTHQAVRLNLALLYGTMGDFAEARKILEKLVVERGLSKTLKFQVLNNLGYVLSSLRMFPDAERRLEEARALTADGSENRALALMNLAAMYTWSGDLDRADDVGRKALELLEDLYGSNSRPVAGALTNLATVAIQRGELLKADSLLVQATKALSKESGDHEVFISATRMLALVAQRRGQEDRARTLSRQALELSQKELARMLAFGSETQRLAYQSNSSPYDQLANLGDADLLAEAVFSMKGAVLESLLTERAMARRVKAPADQEQVDRINALKLEIMERIGRGQTDVEKLEGRLKKEQTALARRLSSQPLPTRTRPTPSALQASLEKNQVLVEIIRFQRQADRGKAVPAYGAIILARQGSPKWVDLGDAGAIDQPIEALLRRCERGCRSVEASGSGEQYDVVATLHELTDRLWAPLARTFPDGTGKVLLSTDGATSFLPWAALLDENGKFLAERWQLSQIGSSRDLLRQTTTSRKNTLLAFGDGGGDLPYSRQEIETIVAAAKRQGWGTTVLLGTGAAENDLYRNPRPGVLHLATHGGQLPGDVAQRIQSRLSGNPMYRGYLLLGGGKETLKQWARGTSGPFANDGILTAEEASTLDLSDTWLTVLSACDTGSGEARLGEGVLGLRRGFALAGTRNLVFSLWPIKDDATADFMTTFYAQLFSSEDPVVAFHETQKAELRRWREAGDVASALYRAGGFVVTR